MSNITRIDRVTIAGLALLLMPALTMLHEIGGHAAACILSGSQVTELGAFYVSCKAEAEHSIAARLVALAGPAIDAIAALIVFRLWQSSRGDFARLVLWYVWLCTAFSAAGYVAYSGITGIGDLGPGADGGIGPLPWPLAWRIGFSLAGCFAYWQLVRLGMRTLDAMLGQGPETRQARRTIGHVFYGVFCLAAILASALNPVGLFITLASAAAASFGGKAGLISIGFATRRDGQAKAFCVPRSHSLLVVGIAATAVFASVLGPTLRF